MREFELHEALGQKLANHPVHVGHHHATPLGTKGARANNVRGGGEMRSLKIIYQVYDVIKMVTVKVAIVAVRVEEEVAIYIVEEL